MGKAELIQAQVTEYYKQFPIGTSTDEAFVPWYLAKNFSLSGLDANARSFDGKSDQGFNSFHLDDSSRTSTLHIFQSVYSDSQAEIRHAILGFEKVMKTLADTLKENAPPIHDKNALWNRLAGMLEKNPRAVKHLRINFAVLHLSDQASEVLWNTFSGVKDRFDAWARQHLRTHHVALELIGPDQINPTFKSSHIPPEEQTLQFEGVELPTEEGIQYFVGIGRLSDLVHLYEQYGDQLFSKNVRAFLYRALEKGPARYMRDTLKKICDKGIGKKDRVPATHFAIFHNGVTLYTLSAEVGKGKVIIRDPSILNGCQTVKNAYLLKHSFIEKNGDETAWENIPIPLRIIVTSDEGLIRDVTVSNNRQNAIRPSAFRANDPIQLELAERFRAMHILYERQEGSYENLKKSDPKRLQLEYPNSNEGPIPMEELCQTIASALNQPALSVATKISQLFEDAQYRRLFSSSHLKDLQLLVFLRNLLKIIPVVIKDIKEESAKFAELKSTAFKFPVFRALARYIHKHQPQLIQDYGHSVLNRVSQNHPLRQELKRLMSHHHTGLQQLLPEIWWDEEKRGFKHPTDKECVDALLSKTRLQDHDVFSRL